MLLLMAKHINIFCASAASTFTFTVWQHVCCYSRPYATSHFVPQQPALLPSQCGNMCAVTHGHMLLHILCLSSQHFYLHSVATCVLLLMAICYFTFCASAASTFTFTVWQHVCCYSWPYATSHFVPQQPALLPSQCGNMCAVTHGHMLLHILCLSSQHFYLHSVATCV